MTFAFIKCLYMMIDGHSKREVLEMINLHKKSLFIQYYVTKPSPIPQICDFLKEIARFWKIKIFVFLGLILNIHSGMSRNRKITYQDNFAILF